ncbi:hypothetical protein [Sporomusa termitida]|uniref:Uncharacterized protein n=1 Tax=Sporomusa termitida TaxID=2377 RepID=A0A517DNK2_9FIRM|nr:hypothetical protein [Sporomusa termitida]QDR78922.1 hypothetical protein SPTER_01730 [Sporomusa termitida]
MAEPTYQIEVRLCSEAIFSSGEKECNLVQDRVLTDKYGLVYLHAKTFKGQLKRQAFWLLERYRSFDQALAQALLANMAVIFGMNQEETSLARLSPDRRLLYQPGIMHLGHLELDERIRQHLIGLQAGGEAALLSPFDLIEAQTNTRTGIQIADGAAKDGRLTTYHTVKQGMVFYSTVRFTADPEPYLADLQRIVCSLDRLGAGIHRGRGLVKAQFLINGQRIPLTSSKIQETGAPHGMLSGY